MLLPENEHTFRVKVKGERSGESFDGDFTVKSLLNNEEMVEVAIRTNRYCQGMAGLPAHVTLFNRTIAELEMRVVKYPTWWKESDYGRLLHDTNVVYEVFTKAMEGEKKWSEKLAKEAENIEEKKADVEAESKEPAEQRASDRNAVRAKPPKAKPAEATA